jgi:MFS family permease
LGHNDGLSTRFGVLQHRPLARLVAAGFISGIGDWLLVIALPIFVYGHTGSTLRSSFTMVVELGAALVVGQFAGLVVDRYDRRRVMVTANALQAVLLLPLLFAHSGHPLWIVYVTAGLQSAIGSFAGPAENALLPSLVSDEELVQANSIVGAGADLAKLIGATAGGTALAVAGLRGVVVADAVSFAAVALLMSVRFPKVTTVAPVIPSSFASPWQAWREGLRVVRKKRALLAAFVIVGLNQLAQGIALALVVAWVVLDLHRGAASVGVFRGAQVIGSFPAGLLIAAYGRSWAPERMLKISLLLGAFIEFAIWNGPAITDWFGYYLILQVALGFPGVAAFIAFGTIIQRATPAEFRGRVFSLVGTVAAVSTLASVLVGGWLGTLFDPRHVLNGTVALEFLNGLAAVVLFRRTKAAPDVR